MKKVSIKATTGTKGKPDYKEITGEAPQYDSVAEAVKLLKEEVVLELINRQVKTDELNKIRKPSGGGLGRLISKAPPEAKDQIAAILKKYGVTVS